ncbi:MAG: hypothetical protein IIA45_00925 [Bacteroidetes bacterium]|nr:hypothetical protein [Bacteroidota bacterium]
MKQKLLSCGKVATAFGVLLFLCLNSFHGIAQDYITNVTYAYYDNSSIVYDSTIKGVLVYERLFIKRGKYVVFDFSFDHSAEDGNASVAPTRILFQVDRKLDQFEIRDQRILEQNGMYGQVCKCADRGYTRISDGVISGVKMENGRWQIKMDVNFKGRFTKKAYSFHLDESFQKARR